MVKSEIVCIMITGILNGKISIKTTCVVFACILFATSCNKEETEAMTKAKVAFEKAQGIEYQLDDVLFDYWQSPKETMKRGAGDCEDKAFYLDYLLTKDRIKSRVVFGRVDIEDSQWHVWNECDVNGKSYLLDTTCGFVAKRNDVTDRYFQPKTSPVQDVFFQAVLRDYVTRTGDTTIVDRISYPGNKK